MDWLLERFAGAGTRAAFVHRGRSSSYAELLAAIARFESVLRERGVQAGDRVVLVGDYTPESFALMLALARNGNLVIPLTRDSVVEHDQALRISGAEWMVDCEALGAHIDLQRHHVECNTPLMASFRAQGRAGLVLFSSGSTGRPKGMLHDFARVAEKFRKPRAPVVAIPFLMFDHFGGFNTILAITAGLGTVVGVAERNVTQVCDAIARHRVELLPTTPSFLNLLMAGHAHRTYDLSSLRRITYGTEVMPQATLDRLRQALPGVILQQTYGLSEVGVLASQSREDGSLWMRLGGHGFETRVVDGVLWIRSAFSMVGYLNAPSAFDEEGWFNTQDRVEVDGEYFKVLGRVTDLINVGGQKVYPAEVEDVIMSLPNVVDVAVQAEANALLGQSVVARIVLAEPEPPAALKQRVRLACRDRLAAYKVPARVMIADGALYTARQKKRRTELLGT